MNNLATEVKVQAILMPGASAVVSNVIDTREFADHIGIQIHMLPGFTGSATINMQGTTVDPSTGGALVAGWATIQEQHPFEAAANFSITIDDTNPEFVANGQAVIAANLTCREAFLRATIGAGSATAGFVVLAVGKPKRTVPM